MKASIQYFRRLSLAFLVILVIVNSVTSATDSGNKTTNPTDSYDNSTLISDDEYIKENERNCFTSRRIFACVKFKTARFLWKLASNSYNYFPSDYSRDISSNNHLKIVHLSEPSGVVAFENARSLVGL